MKKLSLTIALIISLGASTFLSAQEQYEDLTMVATQFAIDQGGVIGKKVIGSEFSAHYIISYDYISEQMIRTRLSMFLHDYDDVDQIIPWQRTEGGTMITAIQYKESVIYFAMFEENNSIIIYQEKL